MAAPRARDRRLVFDLGLHVSRRNKPNVCLRRPRRGRRSVCPRARARTCRLPRGCGRAHADNGRSLPRVERVQRRDRVCSASARRRVMCISPCPRSACSPRRVSSPGLDPARSPQPFNGLVQQAFSAGLCAARYARSASPPRKRYFVGHTPHLRRGRNARRIFLGVAPARPARKRTSSIGSPTEVFGSPEASLS